MEVTGTTNVSLASSAGTSYNVLHLNDSKGVVANNSAIISNYKISNMVWTVPNGISGYVEVSVGSTLSMADGVTVPSVILSGGALNLYGTAKIDNNVQVTSSTSSLTLENGSSVGGNISVSGSGTVFNLNGSGKVSNGVAVSDGATANLNGGSITSKANGEGTGTVTVNGGAVVNLNGSKISNTAIGTSGSKIGMAVNVVSGTAVLSGSQISDSNRGINVDADGTVILKQGSFSNLELGVFAYSGTIKIDVQETSGLTFSNIPKVLTINNNPIEYSGNWTGGSITLCIASPSAITDYTDLMILKSDSQSDVLSFVSNLNIIDFSSSSPVDACAAYVNEQGMAVVINDSDDHYFGNPKSKGDIGTVWLTKNLDPVAKIGNQGYQTLNDAFKDAGDNQTITILRNINESFTADLAGKNVTITSDDPSNRKVIGGDNTILTFKAGTITFQNIILGSSSESALVSNMNINNEGAIIIFGSGSTVQNIANTDTNYGIIGHSDKDVAAGEFRMEGTSEIKSLTSPTGPIRIIGTQKFIMNGGIISDCHSTKEGSVFFVGGGSITIAGGSITNNSSGNGSVVYLHGSYTNSITMTGGSISGNEGIAAIYIGGANSSVIVSDKAVIRGQSDNDDEHAIVTNGNPITISGELVDGSYIGVNVDKAEAKIAKGTDGYEIKDSDLNYIHVSAEGDVVRDDGTSFVKVSGEKVPYDLAITGYEGDPNSVWLIKSLPAVAEVYGDSGVLGQYSTLQGAIDAFKALKESSNVKGIRIIVDKLELTSCVTIDVSMELDGNGNTILRGTDNKVDDLITVKGDDVEVTFKNVTIDGNGVVGITYGNNNTPYETRLTSVYVTGGASLTLDSGTKIQNGGSGVWLYDSDSESNSTLIVKDDVTISGNTGAYKTGNSGSSVGGIGVYGDGTTFIMYGGTISDNESEWAGGLNFWNNTLGTAVIYGGTISGNEATRTADDWGAGGINIVQKGKVQLVGGTIENNTRGGGVKVFDDSSLISLGGDFPESSQPIYLKINGNTGGNLVLGVRDGYSPTFTVLGGLYSGSEVFISTSDTVNKDGDVQIGVVSDIVTDSTDSISQSILQYLHYDSNTDVVVAIYDNGSTNVDSSGTLIAGNHTHSTETTESVGTIWFTWGVYEAQIESDDGKVTKYSVLQKAIDDFTVDDDKIVLLADIEFADNQYLEIKKDSSVVMLVDGKNPETGQVHTIKRLEGSTASDLIAVSGGTITFSNITIDGGKVSGKTSVLVNGGASLTLDSGTTIENGGSAVWLLDNSTGLATKSKLVVNDGVTIQNNTGATKYIGGRSSSVGGIGVGGANTEFVMNGGTIQNNTGGWGGGLNFWLNAGGAAVINGGTITGNDATQGAGGVIIDSNGYVQIAGGTITGNYHGGVNLFNSTGAFSLGGDSNNPLVIDDNWVDDSKSEKRNLVVGSKAIIDVVGNLQSGSVVYITAANPTASSDVKIGDGVDSGESSIIQYLHSDSSDAVVIYDNGTTNRDWEGAAIGGNHDHEKGTIWFSVADFVAQIEDQNGNVRAKFSTLQAAVDAAYSGETVVLLKDVTEDIIIGTQTQGKDIVLRSDNTDGNKVISGYLYVYVGTVELHDITIGSDDPKVPLYNKHVRAMFGGTLIFGDGTVISNINNVNYTTYKDSRYYVIGSEQYGYYPMSDFVGHFVMQDGAVIENLTSWYGPIRLVNGSTFVMEGGEITGCNSSMNEGNVFYLSNSYTPDPSYDNATTLLITGGSIHDNGLASGSAKGTVFLHGNGGTRFVMTGGEITGNKATYGGGVFSNSTTNKWGPNKIIVGDEARIIGNSGKSLSGGVSNIYLSLGQTIQISDVDGEVVVNGDTYPVGHLSGDAVIGVYVNGIGGMEHVMVATNGNTDDIQYIFSDVPTDHGIAHMSGSGSSFRFTFQDGETGTPEGVTGPQDNTIWLTRAALDHAIPLPEEQQAIIDDIRNQLKEDLGNISDEDLDKLVSVTYDPNRGFLITLKDDIQGTINIQSGWTDLTIDLNGHSITGKDNTDEKGAIHIADPEQGEAGTDLTIIDSHPTSTSGVYGSTGSDKNGNTAITSGDNATGSLTIGTDAKVVGGHGANTTDEDAGNGGAGIDVTVPVTVTDNATVTGGNGGNASKTQAGNGGLGGDGGAGIIGSGDVTVSNGGKVTGGNGGIGTSPSVSEGETAGGDGGAGISPETGTEGGHVTVDGGTIAGGNGGNSGVSGGSGGNGGAGIDADGTIDVDSENGTITGGNGGNGSPGGTSAGGNGGDGGAGIDADGTIDADIDGTIVTGGNGGQGGSSSGNTGGNGGNGGSAITPGTDGAVDITGGSDVTGGNGGAAGQGATDGAGGNGGDGVGPGTGTGTGGADVSVSEGSDVTGGNGGTGNNGTSGGTGGTGIDTDGTIDVDDSTVTGGTGGNGTEGNNGGDGGHGIDPGEGGFDITGSDVTGGNGGNGGKDTSSSGSTGGTGGNGGTPMGTRSTPRSPVEPVETEGTPTTEPVETEETAVTVETPTRDPQEQEVPEETEEYLVEVLERMGTMESPKSPKVQPSSKTLWKEQRVLKAL